MFEEKDKSSTPEHSTRAKWVTHLVSVWIANDGELIGNARRELQQGGAEPLGRYLTAVLKGARRSSAGWHVKQELAPNDYDRIRWSDVADEIREEE